MQFYCHISNRKLPIYDYVFNFARLSHSNLVVLSSEMFRLKRIPYLWRLTTIKISQLWNVILYKMRIIHK